MLCIAITCVTCIRYTVAVSIACGVSRDANLLRSQHHDVGYSVHVLHPEHAGYALHTCAQYLYTQHVHVLMYLCIQNTTYRQYTEYGILYMCTHDMISCAHDDICTTRISCPTDSNPEYDILRVYMYTLPVRMYAYMHTYCILGRMPLNT